VSRQGSLPSPQQIINGLRAVGTSAASETRFISKKPWESRESSNVKRMTKSKRSIKRDRLGRSAACLTSRSVQAVVMGLEHQRAVRPEA
jgi:hypothetical protein